MAVSVGPRFRGRNISHELWNAARPPNTSSWHTIFSFSSPSNTFLRTIPKGAQVYVEAGYELRDADPDAEAGSPQAQRQIFLRHGTHMLCCPQSINGSSEPRLRKHPRSEVPNRT